MAVDKDSGTDMSAADEPQMTGMGEVYSQEAANATTEYRESARVRLPRHRSTGLLVIGWLMAFLGFVAFVIEFLQGAETASAVYEIDAVLFFGLGLPIYQNEIHRDKP